MPLQALSAGPTIPAFRPFDVRVAAVHRLTPHFLRITFTGEDLDELASGGADQRMKLLFPLPGDERPVLPDGDDWYAAWRALPADRRCPMRTYTVRAARPLQRELDVDVVLHGATGPASAWAETAQPGDEIVLVGPNARFPGAAGGVEWRPPAGGGALLLAGDETAVPAISAIAEALPVGTGARVVLEVPTEADVLELDVPADVQLTWLPRRHGGTERPRGVLLRVAVEAAATDLGGRSPSRDGDDLDPDEPVWEVPVDAPGRAGAPYVWLAGEAGVVTQLRRHLLREVGLDRRSVAFMGYWRQGRGEAG
jgi:NADPH-dependent ferric siderophore reductase